MMSSIHALQSSTTREKLLKSVQALRPFLCESLRKSGFDPFEYLNGGGGIEHDTYLQTPQYGNEKDSLIQSYNSGNLGSEEHGMSAHDQAREHQVHMIYGGNEGNAQHHGQHADHVDEGQDGEDMNQQYDPIGYGHSAIVHDEGNGLCGYVHDELYVNDLVPDQCTVYGHEGNTPNSSVSMLELSTDIPGMFCSLEPSAMCLQGMHSLVSLGFSSQDDSRFPTEETFEPALHPHNLYSYPHLQGQEEFQHYPECLDIIDGTVSSMYNINLYTHEASCNDNAINQLPIASTPVFLSAASVEAHEVTKTTCAKSASLSPSQQRKKRRTEPLPDANAKRNNSFDKTDALEEDRGDNCSNPNAAKAPGSSSNLVCERRRRKKINEALYALRSVVPNVSKMDKASIMSDALAYAKQLRKRVDDLQNDIYNLHVGKDDVDHTSIDDEHVQEESCGSTNNPNKGMDFEKYCQSLPKHKILELGVFNMENNTYHLRICCEKGPGDLLQLTKVIEDLNFDILNSSVASVGDQSTINTVVKVDIDEVKKPEEMKEMMLDVVNKYGLHM